MCVSVSPLVSAALQTQGLQTKLHSWSLSGDGEASLGDTEADAENGGTARHKSDIIWCQCSYYATLLRRMARGSTVGKKTCTTGDLALTQMARNKVRHWESFQQSWWSCWFLSPERCWLGGLLSWKQHISCPTQGEQLASHLFAHSHKHWLLFIDGVLVSRGFSWLSSSLVVCSQAFQKIDTGCK